MSRQKHCGIVILGMHRSGTSAVAGAIAMAGGVAPFELMPASEDNPRGYWESQRIVHFNNSLLASAGARWNVAGRISKRWFDAPEREIDAARAADLICAAFPDAGPLVLKDPRICRLLPIWKRAFQMLGGQWYAVLVTRNPMDVASSLRRRIEKEQFRPAAVESILAGLLLWLRYNIDAERHSRDMRRTVLDYGSVLENRDAVFTPSFLESLTLKASPETTERIRGFLDPQLNREGVSHAPREFQPNLEGLRAAEAVRRAMLHGDVPTLEKFRSNLNRMSGTSEMFTELQIGSILEHLDGLEFQP